MGKIGSNYKKINLADWNRKEHFSVYRSQMKCGFSLTTKINITNLLPFIKENSYKFYPVMIYLITRAVNNHDAFKMAMKEGELIVWDYVNPIYTVLHPETETFSALSTVYDEDFAAFMDNYNRVAERHADDLRFFPETPPENHFNISAIPWINFDSFNLHIADFTDYFAPSFTIGKYQQQADEILMPIAIQVHHAVCDGIHVAKLIATLEAYCKDIGTVLKSQV
ncbi:type A chloramphenicol O-acetyltransferase [Sphingobacterium sp. BIGb0165]|uniref:type A chloramphenicol O-acetyltransferase n=1 Tax=Sphingobacterium sp. BIGb0165 TaxID=2940615 RepID=UPI002167D741|nr:type A chloramphenicol O-acetyltransferase [Sphingobacterium sp. BIGb0165]MCS4224085.1 chloramphenicol O-acetyltransferase type A [Sphingobacterium sp. BIGb0165]